MLSNNNPEVVTIMEDTPPESQFSMNWQMIDGYGGNVQITMRATRLAEWGDVLKARKEFCTTAQEHGWTFPGALKPTATAPSPIVAPPGVQLVVTPPPVAPAVQAAAGVQTLTAASMKVTPLPEGKVKIEFWNPGREWAEITATKTPEQAAAMLGSGWTVAHFKTAQVYALPVTIEWRNSERLNRAGKPFKDILKVTVTPA